MSASRGHNCSKPSSKQVVPKTQESTTIRGERVVSSTDAHEEFGNCFTERPRLRELAVISH